MAVTAIGTMYARLIRGGVRTFPEGVPERYLQDTIDSWAYLYPSLPPLVGEE